MKIGTVSYRATNCLFLVDFKVIFIAEDLSGLGDKGSSALQRRSRALGGPHYVRSADLLHLRMRQNQHLLLFQFVESRSPPVGL